MQDRTSEVRLGRIADALGIAVCLGGIALLAWMICAPIEGPPWLEIRLRVRGPDA